jgi:ATP-dependent helicase HepA
MIDDPYRCLVAGAQAARRRVEGLGLAIGGALGVAAEPYPHQIAAVRRILTDTRVRHLISDEVGLGKTVQALMVLNALRYQNAALRAVILVPDRLVGQWHTECWTRGHTRAAIVEEPSELDEPYVKIVRPQSLQSGAFQLDPDEFDLLIVDEPQIMPVEVTEQVERVAGQFRQLLVLSATPGLGDRQKRLRMMALLEPERTGAAVLEGRDPDAALDSLEDEALAGLAEDATEGSVEFRTYSRARRIIRATRAAWSRYLPKRRYERVATDTLAGEDERVRLGLEWLDRVREGSGGLDRWRALQGLHRGTASARSLIRSRADRDGRLSAAVAASGATPGDSRFDALVETMSEIWSGSPDEQIVVVAGDNPTIDFLSSRIPRYFSASEGDLEVATLRRLSEATESEAADIAAMHNQLSRFSKGAAKVLLIGEWIQAGLNLHYFARNIIFYSSPWDTDSVDQLIGRLDRLRPGGLRKGDAGDHFGNIRVWSVVQPGTPEQRVVEGLETVGVYEKPLPPLSPEEAGQIRADLERLSATNDVTARQRLEKLAASWSDAVDSTVLGRFSPFTPSAAQAAYDELQATDLPQPVLLDSTEPSFTARSERALEGWLKFINKAGFFQIIPRTDRQDNEVKFWTIWYPEGGEKNATIRLSREEMPAGNWMSAHQPFIFRRRQIGRPPRNFVHTDEGEPDGRTLRFLDHGDSLHDELVEGFISHAQKVCVVHQNSGRTVLFDPSHPALGALHGKTLLAAAGWIDPAHHGLPAPDLGGLELAVELAPTPAQRAAARADLEMAQDWWRADQRWLRSRVSPALLTSVLQLEGSTWTPVAEELGFSILDPSVEPKDAYCARSRGNPVAVSDQVLASGRRTIADGAAAKVSAICSSGLARIAADLDGRIRQVEVEMDDLVALRTAEAERRKEEPVPAQEQARQLRLGRIAAAERRIEMAIAAKEARLTWLRGIPKALEGAAPGSCGEILFRPVKADLDS